MRGSPLLRAAIVVACALGAGLGPPAASALAQGNEILFVVQGGTDPTCAAGCASVQQAVNRAGRDLQSGAAASALIEVGPGIYRGDVAIPYLPATAPLTIQGAGSSTQLIGAGDAAVVIVQAGSRVAITDLSITGGNSPDGGGVDNAGDLTLLRDTVSFNAAYDPPTGRNAFTGAGGGILSTGSLTLQDSTVRTSGTLAFRSQPITLSATARANGHTVAKVRTTPLRPGQVSLLLVPNRQAAHLVRSSRVHTLTVVITTRGGAGTQVRHVTIRLAR